MTTLGAESLSREASSKGLHIGLWVAQGLLAVGFGMAGFMKLTAPLEQLAAQMAWVGAVPGPMVRFIAAAEFLGALGVVLPAATRVQPKLTALAGAGLATVMTLAALFHATRGEFGAIVPNLVLGGIAAFVAWGRWTKAPIAPRA